MLTVSARGFYCDETVEPSLSLSEILFIPYPSGLKLSPEAHEVILNM